MLKVEPREVSWAQYFHDQAIDSREYIKKVADQIPVEIRDALLSVVTWAEAMERCCDSWCDIVFKQTEREIETNMFLEEQIRQLFTVIRATKHGGGIPALRETAKIVHYRIRDWKYEAEQKRLQEQGVKILSPSPSAGPHIQQ
jgi:hypothetical protein